MTRVLAHLLLLTSLPACSSLKAAHFDIPSGKDGGLCGRTVAFLFLASDGLPLEKVWRKFLDGCTPISYTVHIHSQASKSPPASLAEARMLRDPIQGTLRNNYTMQQAMNRLYREAYGKRAPNGCRPRWFQMLSETCAPLRSCAEYQDFLGKSLHTSFIESWNCTVNRRKDACYGRKPPEWKLPWYKAHQWSTLWMDHVQMLLDHERENEKMWRRSNVPDEHYTINLLDTMGARHEALGLTHVYPFIEQLAGHPESISCNASRFSEIGVMPFNTSVQDVVSAHRFFARKFDAGCVDDLLRNLPGTAGRRRGSSKPFYWR